MNAKHKGAAMLWLVNLVGNAALIAAVYFWLLLPDAHGWQVAFSGVLALVVIFCGLWLRAGSFAYFRVGEFRENAGVWRAFHHALGHIFAVLCWLIPFVVLEWCLFLLRRYAPQFGVWFWQKSGIHIGSPRATYHAADCLLLLLMCIVLPIIWLPVASTVAAAGLKPGRMSRSLRLLRRPAYWLWYIVLLVIGAYIPYKLIRWIPGLSTLSKQAWSAGVRFALAYLLLISAWVSLLLVVGSRAEKEDPEPIPSTLPETPLS
ncbi:MAG TPA: hypothetical protein VKB58_04195 [Terriglobales bacterium]|jgi:hypothetical protein|nr:hypothetical protein [Terriglobales bacterium]